MKVRLVRRDKKLEEQGDAMRREMSPLNSHLSALKTVNAVKPTRAKSLFSPILFERSEKYLHELYSESQIERLQKDTDYLNAEKTAVEKEIAALEQKIAELERRIEAKMAKERDAVGKARVDTLLSRMWGRGLYAGLQIALESNKAASEALNAAGVKGIAYDGRRDGRCFVVFDDKAIKVLKTYYQEKRNAFGVPLSRVTIIEGNVTKEELDAALRSLAGKDLPNLIECVTAQVNARQRGKLESAKATDKSVDNGFAREEHQGVAAQIANAWKWAAEARRGGDDKNNMPDVGIRRYVSALNVNGRDAFAWLTIKETPKSLRLYSVELMDEKKLRESVNSGVDASTTTILHRSFDEIIARLNAPVKEQGNILAEMKLAKEVESWVNLVDGMQSKPETPQLILTQTPLVFHLLGAEFREVYAAPHVFDGMFPGEAKKWHNVHPNIDAGILKQLPAALADPIAVFKSNSVDGRLVFMLDVKDAHGATVVLPVQLDAQHDFATIHIVTSAYSKEKKGVPNNKWFETQAGNLIYVNRKKEERWNTSSGSNSLWVLSNALSEKTILTEKDLVKLKKQFEGYYAERNNIVMGSYQQFQDPEKFSNGVITFFESADISTAGHEIGHWLRQVLETSAILQNGQGTALNDWKAACDFVGADMHQPWSREQEEKFADAFVSYLQNGHAPNHHLANAFVSLKNWLTNLYARLSGRENVTISPEIAQVFDNLLISERQEQIVGQQRNSIKEQLLKVTRNGQKPYSDAQANAYADIIDSTLQTFAERTGVPYQKVYENLSPAFSAAQTESIGKRPADMPVHEGIKSAVSNTKLQVKDTNTYYQQGDRKMEKEKEKKNVVQTLAEEMAQKLIEKLKEGVIPWKKEWDTANAFPMPHNPVTNKAYRGGNLLQLFMQDYEDTRWMTYKQAQAIGAQVRKGEKSTPIVYWKCEEMKTKLDEHGNPVLDENGHEVKEKVRLQRPRPFISYVFNAEQIDGMPPQAVTEKIHEWEPLEKAEEILTASGAKIEHKKQGQAYYSPSQDKIVLPEKTQFHSPEGYYSTALHELGHWTGHETRLNRAVSGPVGSADYAREELRAELASAVICTEIGVPNLKLDNSAAYLNHWIKALQDDPREILRAASAAEKIREYVMNFARTQKLEASQTQEVQESASVAAKATLPQDIPSLRTYLSVPYKEKDEAKEMGAKWDRDQKSWYIPDGMEKEKFLRWITENKETIGKAIPEASQELTKHYLAVPYTEKEEAKKAGAKWDKHEKCWYVEGELNKDKVSRWLPENHRIKQTPAMQPQEEFA